MTEKLLKAVLEQMAESLAKAIQRSGGTCGMVELCVQSVVSGQHLGLGPQEYEIKLTLQPKA